MPVDQFLILLNTSTLIPPTPCRWTLKPLLLPVLGMSLFDFLNVNCSRRSREETRLRPLSPISNSIILVVI